MNTFLKKSLLPPTTRNTWICHSVPRFQWADQQRFFFYSVQIPTDWYQSYERPLAETPKRLAKRSESQKVSITRLWTAHHGVDAIIWDVIPCIGTDVYRRFRRYRYLPSSGLMNVLDDGESRIVRDFGKFLSDYTASLLRRQQSSESNMLLQGDWHPLPETQNLMSYAIPSVTIPWTVMKAKPKIVTNTSAL